MAVSKTRSYDARVEDLLVTDFTVGGDAMDRAFFYQMTKDATKEDLDYLRDRVKKRVCEFERSLADGGFALPGHGEEKAAKRVDSWFGPWNRIAGEMEDAIERKGIDAGKFDEEDLSVLVEAYAKRPDLAPYLDMELKGFVANRCRDMDLDYFLVHENLRYPEGEKLFREDFPFLVTSQHDDLLKRAYSLGKERGLYVKVTGLETVPDRWDRYLHLGGVSFAEGAVVGVGFIGGSGPQNCYLDIDDGNRGFVRKFDSLDRNQRVAVLDRLFYRHLMKPMKEERMGARKPGLGV